MVKKVLKATKKRIKNYWYTEIRKHGKFTEVSKASFLKNNQCFACERGAKNLERAHILARCEGGPDSLNNLHLLCSACHHQSEILSGEVYWIWFDKQTMMHSKLYYIFKYDGIMTQDIFDFFFKDKLEEFCGIPMYDEGT